MIPEPQRKILRPLFAAYFHQDWLQEAETPDQVISMYAADATDPDALDALIAGIGAFVAAHPDEDALAEALFRELGCYYAPKALGQSTRAWLAHVAARLEAERPGVAQRAAARRAAEELDEDAES